MQHDARLTRAEDILVGLRLGGVGVWRWRIGSDALQWTDNLAALHRLDGESFDGALATLQRHVHPDDVERVWATISAAAETGES